MKTRTHIFFLFITVSLLTACKECPPDEYFGIIDFHSETNSFLKRLEDRSVVFSNVNGDELLYVIQKSTSAGKRYYVRNYGIICDRWFDESILTMETPTSARFYTQQNIEPAVRSGLDFNLYAFIKNLNKAKPTDTILVDFVRLRSYLNNMETPPPDAIPSESRIEFYASTRENENILSVADEYLFHEEVNLMGRNFKQVFSNATKPMLWFNRAFGIIGFEDADGELWIFNRFE